VPLRKNIIQLLFISVAAFFDGFDFVAITQILPNLRLDLGLNEFQGGLLISFINIGAIISYFLLRLTDKFGRYRLLNITIIGYTISTFFSGIAPEIYSFAIFQLFARIFLIAEVSIAIIYASEEFSAGERGFVIGLVQGFLSLGMISCAAIIPMLLKLPFGWRNVYFIGLIPLLMIIFARRSIKETKRYLDTVKYNKQDKTPLLFIWKTPYRKRLIHASIIWLMTYACTHSTFVFWKEFAVAERNFSDEMVAKAVSLASIVALPMVFLAGRFLDRAGRKTGAVVIFSIKIISVICSFTLTGFWPLTFSLIFGIFGTSAILIVLNAFTAELFPTDIRGNAFAWANHLIGRLGYVLFPVIIGFYAQFYGWGTMLKSTGIFIFLALILIMLFFPETKNKELEITSQL
jgi:putative MFS transporter